MDNKCQIWAEYLKYLREWTNDHAEPAFYGMTPACFDEWLDCEYEEQDEVQ